MVTPLAQCVSPHKTVDTHVVSSLLPAPRGVLLFPCSFHWTQGSTSEIRRTTYRSPVKEWQVSWFALGTITLNGTHITVKRLDRNVKTLSADSSTRFAKNGVCAFQSYRPQNKPADLPLFYWRPVHSSRSLELLI